MRRCQPSSYTAPATGRGEEHRLHHGFGSMHQAVGKFSWDRTQSITCIFSASNSGVAALSIMYSSAGGE